MATSPRKALYFAWELNHHNVYLSDNPLLSAMLKAVRDCGESNNFREEFSAHLVATGLPQNVRTDSNRSDLWRDYQQLLKEWGLVREYGEGYRLSALGELALDGDQQAALGLAVFRFQYPNAYKRRYPKWSRLSRPEPRETSDWSEYLETNGVCLRPAVVMARILMASDPTRIVSELSKDDVRERLFRITSEPASDAELLDRFFEPPTTDWAPHTKRNAEEWMRALVATGLFSYSNESKSLSVTEHRRASLAELLGVISSEPHWISREGDDDDPEARDADWFQHSQGLRSPQRIPDLAEAPNQLQPPTTSPASAEILARPHTRRKQYEGVCTKASIGFDSAAAIARQRAAEQLHQDVIEALAAHLTDQGLTPEEDPNSVDLMVCRGQQVEIFEVKTVERSSWSERLRLAVGQLLEYQSRLLQTRGILPETTLVLSRAVPLESWHKDHFRRLGIKVVAFEAGAFVPLL